MNIKTRISVMAGFWERHRVPMRAFYIGVIVMAVGIAVILKSPEGGMKVVMAGGTLAIIAACWRVCQWCAKVTISKRGDKNAERSK